MGYQVCTNCRTVRSDTHIYYYIRCIYLYHKDNHKVNLRYGLKRHTPVLPLAPQRSATATRPPRKAQRGRPRSSGAENSDRREQHSRQGTNVSAMADTGI